MKLEELTALYSPLDIEYSQVMSGPYEDLSYHGEDCRVIAGLKDGRISGFWRPVVAVGDDNSLKFHIERLYDICPNIYYMDFLINGKLSVISQFLLRHGHKARPYYTQIIDLTKDNMHSALRKSYKSLVNKTNGLVPATVKEYQEIHFQTKGQTRPFASWVLQQKMLPVCMIQGRTGAMFHYYKGGAYYWSAAGDNNHAVVWACIQRLKGRGCKYVEMGEQVFSGNPKLVNISKFKRGFGGETKTRLILEK
jgi:hypothetical protein